MGGVASGDRRRGRRVFDGVFADFGARGVALPTGDGAVAAAPAGADLAIVEGSRAPLALPFDPPAEAAVRYRIPIALIATLAVPACSGGFDFHTAPRDEGPWRGETELAVLPWTLDSITQLGVFLKEEAWALPYEERGS